MTLPLMAVGAKGVISVASNASPKIVKAITEPALKGDYETARAGKLILWLRCGLCKGSISDKTVNNTQQIMVSQRI